jgi:DNA-binding Lrp family transcriptional regulator
MIRKRNKKEIELCRTGFYIPLPINLNMLLTQNERDVLNVIRHCLNFKRKYISISVFEIMTGLSENTIRKARDKLQEIGLIKYETFKNNCNKYKINYDKLIKIILELNEEKNPVARLFKADSFRGKSNRKNEKLINKYKYSQFDL